MDYEAGQYCFINIPGVSATTTMGIEWHPFSLTSNPNEPGEISFCIKNIGGFTRKLYEKVCARALPCLCLTVSVGILL